MPIPRVAGALAAVASVMAVSLGCGGEAAPRPEIIRVPADEPTIQKGVAAAKSGDTVLVSPGTYREQVSIKKPGIVIRGTDRNSVILDGADRLDNGIIATADRVGVENLTVRRYLNNGVLVTGGFGSAEGGGRPEGQEEAPETGGARPVRGYRIRHVTAYNNGLYGIYAFVAQGGLIEQTYTSGHPDSGIYVGQCRPCDVVVRGNVARLNAIGYFATNTTGETYVYDNVFSANRLGVALNSEDAETLAPGNGNVVAGNTVAGNDEEKAPEISEGFLGGGIGLAGGSNNRILSNRISGNGGAGILVRSQAKYVPAGNVVEGNLLAGHRADLAYESDGRSRRNCFAENRFGSSEPGSLEKLMPCPGREAKVPAFAFRAKPAPAGPDYRDIPAPPDQPTMKVSALRPASPVSTRPPRTNLNAIGLPR